MSVYNGEQYLEESIQSILDQSLTDFELILVNDGSRDASPAIIGKFAASDSRIRVISRENKGLIASLNEAVSLARGKYVARMDADDISEPPRLTRQVHALEGDAGIVVCGTGFVEFGDRPGEQTYLIDAHPNFPHIELMFGPPIVHPSAMVRTAALRDCAPPYSAEFVHAEDYELWTRLISKGRIVNLAEPLLRLRYRNDSVTRVADRDPFGERYRIISSIQQGYLSRYGIVCDAQQRKLHYLLSDHEKAALYPALVIGELKDYVMWITDRLTCIPGGESMYARRHIMLKYLKVLYSLWLAKKIGISTVVRDKFFYVGLLNYGQARISQRRMSRVQVQ